MSVVNEGYVKTMEKLLEASKQDAFEELYPLVEKLFKETKDYESLSKIYMYRALMYFRLNQIEALIKFIPQHVTFLQKYATKVEFIRFKTLRALALELNGYTEGFYEHMFEMKTYGEEHDEVGLVINATINIGMLKARTNNIEEAIHYFKEAYAIAEKLKHTNYERLNEYGLCINNLIAMYLELQDHESIKAYLHLEDILKQCYLRYSMLYQLNIVRYYAEIGQLDEAKRRFEALRNELNIDEENKIYYVGIVDCELLLAEKLGDVAYEIEVYKKLISIQKKGKQKQLLQRMMQSTYNLKRQELIEVSQCDPLTKLYNRGGFVTQTEQLKRDNKDVPYIACSMIDVDYFKKINDECGHLAGDQVIVQVAAVLKAYEAEGFVCARYGGDEFVLIFLAHDEQYIAHRIEALYEQLRQTVFQYDGTTIPVTVTMGTVYVQRNETCPVDKLLQLADDVMYDVKRNGRAYYVIRHVNERGL